MSSQSGFNFPQPLSERYARRLLKQAELCILRDADFWHDLPVIWSTSQETLRTMRADSVNMLSVVTVPAEQTKVRRKSKFDDDRVPSPACYAILSVMAAGVFTPVPFRVVYGQELLRKLTTANASVSIVSKHGSFVTSRLSTLPFEAGTRSLSTRSPNVWPGFDSASSTQPLSALDSTLSTDTSVKPLAEPSPLCNFLFLSERHEEILTVRAALEVQIMGA